MTSNDRNGRGVSGIGTILRRALNGRVVAIAAAVIGLGCLASCIGQKNVVAAILDDDSTYYRLKVKLSYWGTPQDFDIVVGCNVRRIKYKDGGSTYEAGLVPTVFGRRMYDGKGLVVRAPDACKGETTANGMVDRDFLPVIVVYDNADTLDFGIAYLSEDAYENPLSVLTFGGAMIETATRAEFDEFRRTQTNLVTREAYWSRAGDEVLRRMGLSRPATPWARSCHTYGRYRLPEELRSYVHEQWPKGHPHYWQIIDGGVLDHFDALITHNKSIQSDGKDDPPHSFLQYGPIADSAADVGMPTRSGGGLINLSSPGGTVRFPEAYYPMANDFRIDKWPVDRKDWVAYAATLDRVAEVDLDFRGGRTKGFAYCFVDWGGNTEEVTKSIAGKRIIGRVDGEYIMPSQPAGGTWSPPLWFFERDEYAFLSFVVYLESTRGDV